jgi:hypothetical protein
MFAVVDGTKQKFHQLNIFSQKYDEINKKVTISVCDGIPTDFISSVTKPTQQRKEKTIVRNL